MKKTYKTTITRFDRQSYQKRMREAREGPGKPEATPEDWDQESKKYWENLTPLQRGQLRSEKMRAEALVRALLIVKKKPGSSYEQEGGVRRAKKRSGRKPKKST